MFGAGTSLGLAGCGEATDGQCVPTSEFFREEVWIPTLSATCIGCHTSSGAAKASDFILQPDQVPGYLDANLKTLQDLSRYEVDGQKLLLIKPTQRGVTHGGGEQLKVDSEQYEALKELLNRFENPVACEDKVNVGDYFDGIEQLDEVATLRKATLALTGRLPSTQEAEQVRGYGIDALDPVLDEIMKEDAFFERLTEIFNDTLLTDRYINGNDAVALLAADKFPSYWYESVEDDATRNTLQYYSNVGIAREALNLIVHVVKNDLPYTEILTADYMMFTPYSAKSYGVDVTFKDPTDPWEIAPGKLKDVPHAGILTSTMFLNRFPTTATNRNRARARVIYKFFLDTDILKLGARPLDPTSIKTVNPTMNNANCTVCHELIDPIAATFQNYQARNDYTPLDTTEQMTWFTDMRLPGFGDTPLPEGDEKIAEQWLAKQIVADDRFSQSAVRVVWKGLTGQDLLTEPFDAAHPDYVHALEAYQVQDRVVKSISAKLRDNNYDLKLVFKEIIKTDYFRAKNVRLPADGVLDDDRKAELATLGTAQYMTPEQLDRKIEAVTGYPWRPNRDQPDFLTNGNEYRIFYGGIDSNSITQRISDPNGIMANIAIRLGNEMSCLATARDFSADPSDRLLFPYVERSFVPEDDNQFAVPAVTDAIRANIQHLYDHVLGESYDLNDPEITAAYNLFVNIWKDGKNGVKAGTYSVDLAGACRSTNDYWTGNELPENRKIAQDPDYTIRAWMGVLSFMLSDYKFLHE
ncbi:MAG: DUF1588 domain-containing protein [Nannocystis sp.]|nr:DUF1588 domain-containing protein [Nannocystis sp.]MBA3550488.1 DUF1588 domain-containing protein [Nannocystis sp.]